MLSVLAHTFSTDLPAALAAARQANFAGVVLDPAVYPAIVDASQTGRREIVALLARHEQPLVAIDIRLGTSGLSPSRGRQGGDIEREIDRLTRAMETARGLRTSLVLCDLGPLPPAPDEPMPAAPTISPQMLGKLILPDPPTPTTPRVPVPRDEPFEASLSDALRELGTRADRLGCQIAFRSSLGTFASLHAALARVDCPWFGIDLDPLAMLADEWAADTIFSRLGRLIRHVRGRDGVKGAGNRVTPTEVGKGQIDWREMLALCHDADYRGTITIDAIDLPNRATSALRGASHLRRHA